MGIKIIKTGKALPEYILTNRELEELVDTDNDWIVERTGISSHYGFNRSHFKRRE